jgi:cytochrome c-type biogenesis protein CcmH
MSRALFGLLARGLCPAPSRIGASGARPSAAGPGRRVLWALLLVPWLASPVLAAFGDPAERLQDPALEARAEALGRELRCMVCQNQSIEDSDADLARDLRRIVREKISGGASDEQVMRFVHDRYGDFVLLRPPLRAATALLWAMPAIALGGGMLLILAMRRRAARAAAEPAALSAEEQARLDRLARDG